VSEDITPAAQRREWLLATQSFAYWIDTYGHLYDATARTWTPMHLWASQLPVADALQEHRLVVMLKARQLGMSWLTVGYALWLMLFRPEATALLFSKRDDEAVHLLNFRLRGMYERLPDWMRARREVQSNAHELRLSNGSAALAFPTTGGRSYTATIAVIDEADHAENLDGLLDAVKPTIDGGGSLVLLSTVNKDRPGSPFQRIYRAARQGANDYHPIFLPWRARPDRDAAWYESVKRDVLARTGALDALHQEYPATEIEALAGRTLDRRFPAAWIERAGRGIDGQGPRVEDPAALAAGMDGLPGVQVFEAPAARRSYVMGVDPAEGNPHSDESVACVIDADTGDQVALLAGRFEPGHFAAYLHAVAEAYAAGVLVERNNHGHAVLLALAEAGMAEAGAACGRAAVLPGLDGRPGWLTAPRSKTLAFNAAAELLSGGSPQIRDAETLQQLMDVRGATLSAAPGGRDDRAMAWVLAVAAARFGEQETGEGLSVAIPPVDRFDVRETGGW